MSKTGCRKIIVIALISIFLISLFPTFSFCEIQTITHTVKQPFGGSQSPDDARIAAVAKAKREALEMAGVYVEAMTIVKDAKVDKDEILALTAGVLKAEVISQKNYHTDDAFGIEIIVKVKVDPSLLQDRVKKLLQDRMHLEQLNQARKKEKELLDKMATLEEENRRLMAEKGSSKDLNKQFKVTSQGLTAVDWVDKALLLWVDGKSTDPRKAIEYLDEAIHLKPDYAIAYVNRGNAYVNMGQLKQAIRDYDEAIRLTPDYAEAYSNRGATYANLGQYRQAIKDYDDAIRRKPNIAMFYYNRGNAYGKGLGQHQQAMKDFNQAIRLQPDYAIAYSDRGNTYVVLGQQQRAIEDFNEAIRLKPNLAMAYNNRGYAYLLINNSFNGCRDVIKACELGVCSAYKWAKTKGSCR